MAVLYTNNASTTLASGITNSNTVLSLATGTGSLFPTITAPDFAYVTLIDSSNNIEIVKVTARSGDVLTVVRAQEGTTARSFATGSKVDLRVTAAGLANKLDKDTGGTVSGNLAITGTTALTGGVSGNLAVSGTTVTVNSKLTVQHDGTDAYVRPTNASSKLYLGSNNTTYVTVDASGNVGVGTTTPSTPGGNLNFHVSGTGTVIAKATGTTAARFDMSTATANAYCLTALIDNSGSPYTQTSRGAAVLTTYDDCDNHYFRNSAVSVVKLAINSSGSITSPNLADAAGYKGLPQNSQTAAYTLALADMGKHISITTGGVTIPANASVAFPVGAAVTVFNNSASTQTLAITTDTLRQAGTTNTGSRTIAAYGLATCVKVASTTWVVSGNIT